MSLTRTRISLILAALAFLVCFHTVAAAPDAGIDVAGAITNVATGIKAVQVASDTTAKHMALAGLLAVILKFILDALSRITNLKDSVKRYLPLVCAALGVGVALLTKYAMGSTWTDAVILGGGAPMAVMVNEVLNMLKKPTPAAQATNPIVIPIEKV